MSHDPSLDLGIPPRPPAADSSPAEQAVGDIVRCGLLLRRWMDRQAELDWGMSGPRVVALMRLGQQESMTMGDLAAALGVTPRAVTRLVDGLEHDGYVRRSRDADDGRVVHVSCTASTRDQVAAMGGRFQERIAGLLAPFGGDDLDVTRRVLVDLAGSLEHDLGLRGAGETAM